MPGETTTIRVSVRTRRQLNALAKRRGISAGELIGRLVEAADERALLDEAARGWQELDRDARLRAAYRRETEDLESFDSTMPAW